MKIFISSLIGGFEDYRAAARTAITALGHEPVVAEDFGAQTTSPQIACLRGLRSADLIVLILGPRYGYVQGTSGVSPTHEEYREAKGRKHILIFVQEGVEREEKQAEFISEVSAWETGHFRENFKTADELRNLVTRAIHRYQLASVTAPLDTAALLSAASTLLPKVRQNNGGSAPILHVGILGGPEQRLLRPAELESPELAEAIHKQALFEEPRLFSKLKGVIPSIVGSSLAVEQERGAQIKVGENGSISLRLPLDRDEGARRTGISSFAVIEEDVARELAAALAFSAWLLDRIDPSERISHVAIAVSIEASEYMGWRTQAEQNATPNFGTARMAGAQKPPSCSTDRPRAALRMQAMEIAEDLIVPLRSLMQGT